MYRCIHLDPPWNERGGGVIKRGADRHYKLIPTLEMPRVIYESGVFCPHPGGCHLWLWATMNHLPDALWLIKALGFRYITNVVWVKDRIGLGQYVRGQHEHLLLAVKGSGVAVRTPARNISSVISAPRGKHSAKPAEAYALIEQRTLGPRLDMFARAPREGWTSWGDEL
jgi:N6-adenosine-specific RNA methylase IME4